MGTNTPPACHTPALKIGEAVSLFSQSFLPVCSYVTLNVVSFHQLKDLRQLRQLESSRSLGRPQGVQQIVALQDQVLVPLLQRLLQVSLRLHQRSSGLDALGRSAPLLRHKKTTSEHFRPMQNLDIDCNHQQSCSHNDMTSINVAAKRNALVLIN